jgi:hypothetical protein
VRERLREKLPGEGRSKSIDILFGEFKFCELARKKPYKSWLALLQSFGCPRPVTISLVNTQLAEMYFEDKDTATAVEALRNGGIWVENPTLTEDAVMRRSHLYERGYFRPLRHAALRGLDTKDIRSVLQSAEFMAARIADSRKRKRILHQIEVDKGVFLQEDNIMDEGVVPPDLLKLD